MPKKLRHSAENTLTFSQSVTYNKTWAIAVSSTLAFAQSPESDYKYLSVEDTLTFSQSVDVNNIYYLSASNTLAFSQNVHITRPISLSVGNTLAFSQNARSNITALSAGNQLSFSQSVEVRRPIYLSVSSTLDFTQSATLASNVINLAVTSYLSFSHQAARVIPLSVSNHLHLSHSVITTASGEHVKQWLYFTHTAVAEVTKPTSSLLSFTQVIGCSVVRSLSVGNTLTFTQAASALIPDKSEWPRAPVLVHRSSTQLSYPFNAPTLIIELRNPEFNNQEMFTHQRINRKTRGGKLDIYRDESWPSIQKLDYKIGTLTDVQRVALLNFLDVTLGQEIRIIDFESRVWKALILTPASELADAGPDKHYVTLQFEVELQ